VYAEPRHPHGQGQIQELSLSPEQIQILSPTPKQIQ
jgi:hypothetical protein